MRPVLLAVACSGFRGRLSLWDADLFHRDAVDLAALYRLPLRLIQSIPGEPPASLFAAPRGDVETIPAGGDRIASLRRYLQWDPLQAQEPRIEPVEGGSPLVRADQEIDPAIPPLRQIQDNRLAREGGIGRFLLQRIPGGVAGILGRIGPGELDRLVHLLSLVDLTAADQNFEIRVKAGQKTLNPVPVLSSGPETPLPVGRQVDGSVGHDVVQLALLVQHLGDRDALHVQGGAPAVAVKLEK